MPTIESNIYVLYRVVGERLVEEGQTHDAAEAVAWMGRDGQVAGRLPGGPYRLWVD
jgi:hypothetical protein